MLYPLCFEPVYLTKIWGGEHLSQELGRDLAGKKQVGESWELSGVEGQVSVVSDGPLVGKSLDDLVERYGADLLGHRVMAVHGDRFPLLFKLLSTAQDLSLQVHPNDEQAGQMVGPGALGKTEMWVILGAEPGACLYNGFVEGYDGRDLAERIRQGRLLEVVHRTEVQVGDVFYIPAGRVHTIGAGLLLAEIQQSSDTTYRIDDLGVWTIRASPGLCIWRKPSRWPTAMGLAWPPIRSPWKVGPAVAWPEGLILNAIALASRPGKNASEVTMVWIRRWS